MSKENNTEDVVTGVIGIAATVVGSLFMMGAGALNQIAVTAVNTLDGITEVAGEIAKSKNSKDDD